MYRDSTFLAGMSAEVAWDRYCGFLDLSVQGFLGVQRQRLLDALPKLAQSELVNRLAGEPVPSTVEQFRATVPLTTYDDYLPVLDQHSAEALPEPPAFWARTSRRNSEQTLIPYTQSAFDLLTDALIGAFILSSATGRGEMGLRPDDHVLYNLPPVPFLSGMLAETVAEKVTLRSVLDQREAGALDFHDKISLGFDRALITGVDAVASMTSVLIKMGEDFEQGGRTKRPSKSWLRPKAAWRIARALLASRREGRSILPKDLWPVKSLICWGTDTDVYKEQLRYYWGCDPFEFVATTESGILAMQAWNGGDLTFLPAPNFLEFIPAVQAVHTDWADDHLTTLLLDELDVDCRYEVVITSTAGMPFIRYRTGVLVEVASLGDDQTGVLLPQVRSAGRVDDLIDVAGFTRLDEPGIARAMLAAGAPLSAWSARKEFEDDAAVLRVYVERPDEPVCEFEERLDRSLASSDWYYRDLEEMLDMHPLRVTGVEPGSFERYYQYRREIGADIDDRMFPKINPTDEEVEMLLNLSKSPREPARAA
ncbi:MAG: GH3 auxin-responsive promoter family protein [Dehalococcoidia bacterium]